MVGRDHVAAPAVLFRLHVRIRRQQSRNRQPRQLPALGTDHIDTLPEVEIGERSVPFLRLRLQRVAQPQVQRQLGIHFPVVLNVQPVARVVEQIVDVRRRARGIRRQTQHEVSVGVARKPRLKRE